MIIYFDKKKDIAERNVTCIDVISEKYIIRIRKSGVRIEEKGKDEPIYNKELEII